MTLPDDSVHDCAANRRAVDTKSSLVALNLLRGGAALTVMLVHVRGDAFVEYGALPRDDQSAAALAFYLVTRLGHEAVLIFFVLSGYLVGGQVVRQLREGRFEFASYVADRVSRIYLPLLPAVATTVILNRVIHGIEPDWLQVVGHVVGVNGPVVATLKNNAPLWSLAYEIWFYVLAGAAALAVTGRSPLAALIAMSLGTFVFAYLDARYLLFWGLGLVVACVSNIRYKGLVAALGTLLMVLGSSTYQLAQASKSFDVIHLLPTSAIEAVFCVGTAMIIPLLVDQRTNRGLRWLARPAAGLAAISYSLYLFHYPVNALLNPWLGRADHLSWSSFGTFGVRVFLVLLLISALYFSFEAHTSALRRFLRRSFGSTA